MNIPKEVKKYARIEFTGLLSDETILIKRPDGLCDKIQPFLYQPTRFEYDCHGYESLHEDGEVEFRARYTPVMCGEYHIGDKSFCVTESHNHGYVSAGNDDSRYFVYDDGTSYLPVGINMAFPSAYRLSSGVEFGIKHEEAYLGLRQYLSWFDKCAENGVNMVRLWIGHPYFSPDTEETYKLDYKKLTLLDTIVDMARERNIKLKLTLEQFRYFKYDDEKVNYPAFCKKLYHNGIPCSSVKEWLESQTWQDAWLYKIKELSKRYSGDTTIFAIELWNEMNCFGDVSEWCKKKLPEVKKMFPNHLVTNSYGSLDCDLAKQRYSDFCWEATDVVQIHRYIDQGAPYDICNYPIEMMQDAVSMFLKYNKPVLIAETGAVDDCHSGPFRFYSSDDRGIIFADMVYTPFFCGSCGVGNIWHWDSRYVESKNIYKMYQPFVELCAGVDFQKEQFVVKDYSDENAYILALCGKNTQLLYIRNKDDNWQNVLRDMNKLEEVAEITLPENIKNAEIISIWEEETAFLKKNTLCNLKYGVFVKGKTK